MMQAHELQFGEDHPLNPKHVLDVYDQNEDARQQNNKMLNHLGVELYTCEAFDSVRDRQPYLAQGLPAEKKLQDTANTFQNS